eukprot:5102561-Alexandrium_andersonii.AAC.1
MAARGLIASTFARTPASNIPSEDRFARVSAQHGSCHGRAPSVSTCATRHMLCELQAWHHIHMSAFFERE